MKAKWNARTTVCLVLTILYFGGLALMLTGQLSQGVLLWGVSTVAGMGVLYYIKKQEKDAREQQNEEDEGDNGTCD